MEPSLHSRRSTHLETGPRPDQFRLALPCLPCSCLGASWRGGSLFYNRGREPSQAKRRAPDPWAPLLAGHSTRVLRGSGPVITYPHHGGQSAVGESWCPPPGTYLRQATQPPWASVSPPVKWAGSQHMPQVVDTRRGREACLLSGSPAMQDLCQVPGGTERGTVPACQTPAGARGWGGLPREGPWTRTPRSDFSFFSVANRTGP